MSQEFKQDGKDCLVDFGMGEDILRCKNCNALKLKRTINCEPGDKYSEKQQDEWGFEV